MSILENLYTVIDNDEIHNSQLLTISKLIKDWKIENKVNLGEEELIKCQWEIDSLNYSIHNNQLGSSYQYTKEDGSIGHEPPLKDVKVEYIEYLKYRANACANEVLKARYLHLLWLLPDRNAKYAKKTISLYLKLKSSFEELDKGNTEDRHYESVIFYLQNAALLSIQIKFEFDSIKNKLVEAITNYSGDHTNQSEVRLQLIDFALGQKKYFSKIEFEKIRTILIEEFSQLGIDLWSKINLANLLITTCDKIGSSKKEYYRLKGDAYLELSIIRDDEPIASLDFIVKALELYKKSKETKKIRIAEKRYIQIKRELKLGNIKTNIEVKDFYTDIDKLSSKVSELDSGEILKYLANDNAIFPTQQLLRDSVDEQKRSHPLLFLVSTIIYDDNGNISQRFVTDEEKYFHAKCQTTDFYVRLLSFPTINKIILKSIMNGKLEPNDFSEYLLTDSWLGLNLNRKVNGENYSYNWASIIQPCIISFFNKANNSLQGKRIDLVMEIESLALKFEPIIRDMFEISGGTTFYSTKDSNGAEVTRERDINYLLHNEPLISVLNPDDLFILKFLLIEKAGYNIRNKVAHGFMKYQEYSFFHFNLLFVAFLRISKYQLKSKIRYL